MHRVLILGPCGAGKSTLARHLGARLNLPVVHLDRLFWRPHWVQADAAAFARETDQAIAADRWVIDGNYHRNLDRRLARADTAVYLDFPRRRYLPRLCRRIFASAMLAHPRPDMADDCPERWDWEFIEYAWTFPREQGAPTLATLARHPHVTLHRLRSPCEVAQFLASASDPTTPARVPDGITGAPETRSHPIQAGA